MGNSKLFELIESRAKDVGFLYSTLFILNDGETVTGDFDKNINGVIRRAAINVGFDGRDFCSGIRTEEQMAEVIVERAMRHFEELERNELEQEIRAELAKAAEKADFSYLTVSVEFKNDEVIVGFGKNINGTYCNGHVHTGAKLSAKRPASHLAAIAVARQSEWFARLEEEVREDIAVRDGGKSWLKPSARATKPGHWTNAVAPVAPQ